MISLHSSHLRKLCLTTACVSAMLLSACGGSDDAPPVVFKVGIGLSYSYPQDITEGVKKLGITPSKIECSKSVLPPNTSVSDSSGGTMYLHIPSNQAGQLLSSGYLEVIDRGRPQPDNTPPLIGEVFKKIPIQPLAAGEQIRANAKPCENF